MLFCMVLTTYTQDPVGEFLSIERSTTCAGLWVRGGV